MMWRFRTSGSELITSTRVAPTPVVALNATALGGVKESWDA